MNIETNRLSTFGNWPTSAPVDPIRIAKAGFFYTGEGTEVQCFSCGGKISQWNYGDQVMWRHRNMEPNCAFVVNPQMSGNIPLVLGQECPTGNTPVTNGAQQNVTESQDYGLTADDEMYRSDALRLLSFTNWDDNSVSRESLASAGFYHAGGGRLRCAWCGGELAPFRNFGSLGHPLEVHRMYFPRCAHASRLQATRSSPPVSPSAPRTPPLHSPADTSATQSQSSLLTTARPSSLQNYWSHTLAENHLDSLSGSVHNERLLAAGGAWRSLGVVGGGASHPAPPKGSGLVHNERLLAAGGAWRSLGVVGGGARHPLHAALAARLATFERWPADRQQTPRALADAGFFYTGTDDQVRCFYCDGGLGKWEASDAPWSEHARWFPHCGYVLLVKGQQFVDSCRQSSKQNVPRCLSADSGLSNRRRNPGVTFPVDESQVNECMESDLAMAALGAGLDAARVRRAIVRRFRVTGQPFTSSEALIDAVLDEQLNEEAWSVTPQSQRLARDILAETLRDFAPRSGLIPSSQEDTSDDPRSPSLSNQSAHSEPALQLDNLEPQSSRTEEKKDVPEKKLTLEEENRQLKEARLCKICMDSEVSVVFLPCGHLVSCGGCGAALAACPLCRAAVRALVRTYLA